MVLTLGSQPASQSAARVPKSRGVPDASTAFVWPAAPMFVPACGLAMGICLGDWFTWPVLAWAVAPVAAVLCASLAIWSQRRGRFTLAMLACGAAAAGLGYVRYCSSVHRPADHVARAVGAESTLARVGGQIVTQPIETLGTVRNPFLPLELPQRTTFVVALDRVAAGASERSISGRALVRVDVINLGLRLGDAVELTGRIYAFLPPKNPGETDWSAIRRRQGIDVGMTVPSPALVSRRTTGGSRVGRFVHALRAGAESMLFEPLAARDATECMQLLDVLVLGQRSAADARLNDAFQRAGGVHFLSVGGFHIGILAGFAWGIVRLSVPRARRTAAWITLALTLLYLVLAEQTAPALRGVIGVLLATVAVLLGRPLTAMNWLMSAAFIILLLNPHDLFQASFQLSFTLVLALVQWATPLWDALPARRAEIVTWGQLLAWRALRASAGLVMTTGMCFVAALPLTLFHFQQVAPWGLLGSILLTPLVSLTIILSFVTIAAGALPGPVGGWVAAALAVVTNVLLALVDLLGRLPGAVIHTPQPPAWLIVLTFVAAMVAERLRQRAAAAAVGLEDDDGLRALRRRARRRFAAPFVVALLCWLVWVLLEAVPVRHGHTVRFLAVGDGSATTIVPPYGRAAVFDAGSAENMDVGAIVARSLRHDRAGGIDWALVSHANFDHYSGLPALAELLPIERVGSGPYFERAGCRASDAGRLARRFARPLGVLAAGDRLDVGGGTLEVLWPPADLPAYTSANDASLVARWTGGGVRVLLTGDIEESAIRALLARQVAGAVDLRADVLVAPHHGEVIPQLTGALIAAASPRDVVVSSARVRARFDTLIAGSSRPEIRVHQTARSGCVTVRIDGGGRYTIEGGADR